MMTETLRIGLMASAGCHLLLLIGLNGFDAKTLEATHFIRINAEEVEAVVVSEGGVLELGSIVPEAGADEEKQIEQRRRVYAEYLEAVTLEIHAHRLDFGRRDLIGIAVFDFVVDADGFFTGVKLRKSSGDPMLDDVARRAVLAASGRVKRPKILGPMPIAVEEEVRFQYGLR